MPAALAAHAHPPRRLRLVALATCLGLLGAAPAPALAAPEAEVQPTGSDSRAEAEAIFRRGQAKYETADYNGAIELWTEAYALVDPVPENAAIKALLIYNLAQAHIKAYEFDNDAIHLKQAQQLLGSYQDNLELLYDEPATRDEERNKAEAKIAEVEAKIAAHEQAAAAAEAKARAEAPPPVVITTPSEPIDRDLNPGRPLVLAGGVVTGLGAVTGLVGLLGGLLAAGANDISDVDRDDLQEREDRFAVGRAGNAMVFVGTIGAGVLLPTGIALIVVGAKRNKQARQRSAAIPRLTPSLGPNGAGLTFSGRF